ncbi:MAG: ribosome recycling factor [Candidatus Omnitrophica bacterium]|nr:ribosome recycling factor [Candidatus Omnitrophota bacterium]MBU1995942.1 ribosome recycling factor [Candidatus Omnitrophota bacterium]
MIIKEVIQQTESKMKKSIESARREFSEVRTGRAHPGLIEGLHVDYYGTPTMFKELSSISIPDPRTVLIQPWDPSVIPELEKAITNSKLGVMPSNDGKVVRLNIPPLSEERRHELQKVVKEMAEQARISLRSIRKDANDKIKKLEHDKTIAEDDGFKAHENIQKLIDKYIKEIDALLEEKSKALMS